MMWCGSSSGPKATVLTVACLAMVIYLPGLLGRGLLARLTQRFEGVPRQEQTFAFEDRVRVEVGDGVEVHAPDVAGRAVGLRVGLGHADEASLPSQLERLEETGHLLRLAARGERID